MAKKDPRIDQFIREAAPFARPILKQFRSVVHRGYPKVEETIKWGMPFFLIDGKIVCVMAAFKAHCNIGFWKGRQILDSDGSRANVGMGQKYGRVTSAKDLPSARMMAGYLKQAIALNEKPKVRRPAVRKEKSPARIPAPFARALRADKKANAVFAAFSPSKKRDYIDWITGAKTEETRDRRLEIAVEWIAQGKSRNWKYER